METNREAAARRPITARVTPPAVLDQPRPGDRILAIPIVDRTLARLLMRPRALQALALLIGAAMLLAAVRPFAWDAAPAPLDGRPISAPAFQAGPDQRLPEIPQAPDAQAALATVTAYNQASIAAGLSGQAEAMSPFLAPDGPAWQAIQAEYQRRALHAETHDAALTRWGVLRLAITGDTALVETQEQWDDMTSIGGQISASRRGIVTRTTYTLRRAADDQWRIVTVTSTLIMG